MIFFALVMERDATVFDGEVAVFACDGFDQFVLVDVEFVVFGDAAVVFERFGARRLFVEPRHGDVADFQKLRSGEERHVSGVVIERVGEAALVDDHGAHIALFQFDGTGQAGGSGADDDRRRRCAVTVWPPLRL